MPQSVSVHVIRDIANGVALISFIFAISVYVPVAGFFSALFIPLPVLYYRSKLGRQHGLMVPAAAMGIIAAVMGGITADTLFFAELLIIGFILGELLQWQLTIEKTIGYACLGVLACGMAALFFYSVISHTGITDLVGQYVSKNLDITLSLYQEMGVSSDHISQIKQAMDQIQYVLVRILPALSICSTLFIAWANLMMARAVMTARSMKFPDFGNLALWSAPEPLVWVAIAGGMALMIPAKGVKIVGMNVLLVLAAVYFFQGLAIVSHYFEKKAFPRMFRMFFYALMAIQQFLILLVIAIGFFDMWMNFRKLDKT